MSQFYLTLPSDSSSKYYPDNTTACFKTKLSERIELDGDYEVGLAQLIYPHSWFNFVNDDRSIWVSAKNRDHVFTKHIFSSGLFHDGNALVKHLNDKINLPGIIFHWLPFSRRMRLAINDGYSLIPSNEFKTYFGFESIEEQVVTPGKYYSTPGLDIQSHLRLMYVYCDIASYTFVGDFKAPLLRVCNTEGEYGQNIRLIFTHPHYIPLGRTSFDTLEINIKDEMGRAMPFEFGKAVVTLHFRRRNKLLS